MTGSKQLTIFLCTFGVLALLCGYFYFALRAPIAVEPPFEPIYPNDPQLQEAYNKAQEGLDYFLELAAQPPAETQGFAVKARIQENDLQEFFWLYPFDHEGDHFAGRINDDPAVLLKTFKGDVVEFSRRDIVDWTFDDTKVSVMHGNFTGCVELGRQAPDNAAQFQEFFGLNCNK
jgi:uncharacterized protein YegJ (DUF2314 family)